MDRPTRRDGLLWIYLILAKVWAAKLGTSMPFRIDGVTPGSYRLKAVWDKSLRFAVKDEIGVPGPGDYESGEEPSIEVVAGKSVENLTVVCTNLFKSK